jgi:hypothetical protein
VCACVRVCVCACVRACVRVCVCVCVCVCVHACTHTYATASAHALSSQLPHAPRPSCNTVNSVLSAVSLSKFSTCPRFHVPPHSFRPCVLLPSRTHLQEATAVRWGLIVAICIVYLSRPIVYDYETFYTGEFSKLWRLSHLIVYCKILYNYDFPLLAPKLPRLGRLSRLSRL